MLTLISPVSHLYFTSLSSTALLHLQAHLSTRPSSSHAHLHTSPILTLLSSLDPPVPIHRVCLLDPKATKALCPDDGETFDWFLYGGILGDDPPRDRTAELRKLGFEGRNLGQIQMTTDTAVGVTKTVVEDGVSGTCVWLSITLTMVSPAERDTIYREYFCWRHEEQG